VQQFFKWEVLMSIRNRYALAVCASILAFGFSACEKQGPAEKAGEEIDEAAAEVKEGVNEAADEVKDATN
jgi:hypothetical protein